MRTARWGLAVLLVGGLIGSVSPSVTPPAGAQTRGGTLKVLIIVDSETGMDPHKRLTASTEVMLDTIHETLVEFESARKRRFERSSKVREQAPELS